MTLVCRSTKELAERGDSTDSRVLRVSDTEPVDREQGLV